MSHESEFLIISDPSWIEIQNATEVIQSSQMGEAGLQFAISESRFTDIEPMLEDANIMPPGYTLTNARMVRAAADDLRFWVQWVPLPPNPQ